MDSNLIPPVFTRCAAFAFCVTAVLSVSWSQEPQLVQSPEGYLFIEGRYVQPPYDLRVTDEAVTINNQEFGADDFERTSAEENPMAWRRSGGGPITGTQQTRRFAGRRGFRTLDPLTRFSRQLEQVQLGATVVVFRQERPVVIDTMHEGYELFTALAEGTSIDFSSTLIDPADHPILNRLVSEFTPDASFRARVKEDLQAADALTLQGERSSAANRLVAKISYPLTLFAMIVVVLGFGHLLSNRPSQGPTSDGPTSDGSTSDGSTDNRKVIIKSLSIIALLSLLDLVWTLAATHAGTMRELNPLGSQFIDDPTRLVVFKLLVTGTSLGILYALHRRPAAQVASWWCCLLMTLLTARWVVFQSMFM